MPIEPQYALQATAFERRALDAVPGPLFIFGEAGRLLYWNNHLEETWGYRRDQVAAMHPREFFPAKERPRLGRAVTRTFQEGSAEVEAEIETAETPGF